jgi:hypothetical protein
MSERVDSNSRQKLKVVWWSYCKWFIGTTFLALFASLVAYWLNIWQPFTALQIKVFQIASFLPEAAALG